MTESRSDRRRARAERRRKRDARRRLDDVSDPARYAAARIQEVAAEQFSADYCGSLQEARETGDVDILKRALALMMGKTLPESKERDYTYWRCGECAVLTRPGPLTVHQEATGHRGRTPQ